MSFGSDPAFRRVFRDVLDSRTVQRLRRISQLGLAANVFPGATHSRFLHALGTAHLAGRVLHHLEERADDGGRQVREYRNEVIVSALLHDVGHGPFSHSFERVMTGLVAKTDGPPGGPRLPHDFRPPTHEDWTYRMIAEKGSELAQILASCELDPTRVAAPFADDAESRDRLPAYLRQIVSSQLDVDRMDYLVRDAHFAGVAAGQIDVAYLINTLAVIEHPNGDRTLGLQSKGVKPYEGYALARRLMNRSLYYHKAVKVFEFMMEEFTRRAILALDTLDEPVRSAVPSYLLAVSELLGARDGPGTSGFIDSNMRAYTGMDEPSIWHLVAAVADSGASSIPARLGELARMLVFRRLLPSYRLVPGCEERLTATLADEGMVSGEDFAIIDLRTTLYLESGEKVFVSVERERIEEVVARSEILSLLHDREEKEAVLIALDREKDDRLQSIASKLEALRAD